MQTLSNMRRNSSYKEHIIPFWWIVFLFIYQIFTSLYPYLSPFIGYFFCYLVLLDNEKERTLKDNSMQRNLIFSYLLFTELNKGFYLFSSIIFFYIFKHIISEWLQTSFKCQKCILLFFVIFGYLGIYGINNLIAYTLHEDFFVFGWIYVFYIIVDSLLAFVVFKDQVI